MPRLTVIIAATRPGRAGLPIASWFTSQARVHGGFDVAVVDLAELQLPLLDEPNHPRLRQYTREHTFRWSAIVEASDAFVIVTPEYNHGYPATIKNALDYLHQEWHGKPVGFVSYGGVAGGTRAVQQLKQVVLPLRMLPVVETVSIPFHFQRITGGAFQADENLESAAKAMLDELAR
ncbi:NAD(P)H-dependent oxidoreductase [Kibdelosporangium philippinense]|uniref:NAD(P)H-dependent oxidoreductase n=1 Tax=Kibdelosporangium philippinense TaxID=211113 RepID=A0ABS8Z8X0_9PSEU|nr:NAD(P)H-dependent oxidoreductase [Kibdelosporangium philippinense]MCE7003235.1 NAD(P)H-dependent oxidoreductase [Kibdelosporangium philippinense]